MSFSVGELNPSCVETKIGAYVGFRANPVPLACRLVLPTATLRLRQNGGAHFKDLLVAAAKGQTR